MRQSVSEHLEKLQLELLGPRRGDDRVQLVENRVFSRVIPTGDVFGSKLVLRVWNIFSVKPLLPFLDCNVVGSDESAGPKVAVFRGIEQAVRQVFDVGPDADLLPIVGNDRLGLLVVAPLRRDAKLEFHALPFSINQNTVRSRLPAGFSEKLFSRLRIVLV